MEQKHQKLFLNAISQDLNLMNLISQYVFKPSKKSFKGVNQEWYELLLEAKEKGYEAIDEETVKLLSKKDIQIEETKNAKIDFRNAMEYLRITSISKEKQEIFMKLEKEMARLMKADISVEETESSIKKIKETASKFTFSNIQTEGGNTKELHTIYTNEGELVEIAPTYIEKVDGLIGGGFSKGGITAIGALPGVGKSTLMAQASTVQAVNGYNVLILSLEQGYQDVYGQSNSVLTTMSNNLSLDEKNRMDRSFWNPRRKRNDIEKKNSSKTARKLSDELMRGNLEIESFKYKTLESLIDRIMLEIDKEVDVVYIDNFQNSPKDPIFKNERENYDYLADELDRLAKTFNIAIVALSQVTIKKSGEITTKYSDRLKQNAENFLYLEQTKDEGEEDDPKIDKMIILIEKTRFGKGLGEKIIEPFSGKKGTIGYLKKPASRSQQLELSKNR